MKKAIYLLAMLLLAIGITTAYTETDISFYQADGEVEIHTYGQVEGNYWDYPDPAVPETPTGFVATDIENEGMLNFDQKITQYGNGAQYPNGDANEWSMEENQYLSGSGDTSYNKHFEVWTVHMPYSTEYNGGGNWDMPEGMDSYAFEGTTSDSSNDHTEFNYHVETDSTYNSGSGVWVNPFV